MKKGLVTLIILLAAAGVVFFFGWIQILLPGDTYAVIFSKTGGFDDRVTRPGVFSWRWERLIPTNLTLYRYPLRPYRTAVSVQGSLPSGELYSKVLPENPDFTIKGTVIIELSLSPESLPGLLKNDRLFPDDLTEYYQKSSEGIARAVVERVRRGEITLPPEPSAQARLVEELKREHPQLEIFHLDMSAVALPDRGVYELAKSSYRSLVESRDRSRDAALDRLAEERAKAEMAKEREAAVLESLAAYGELLTRYPALLKAMYVQRLSGKEMLSIPGFDLDKILENLDAKPQ